VVVFGHGTLTLEHLNVNSWLIVLVCGEDLGLLGWDDSVSVDELGHDSTNSLNTEGQRSNIKEKEILTTFTAQNTCLHCCSVSHSFVRIDSTVWLLSVEKIFDELLHLWDTRGSTDEDNLVHLRLLQTTVLHDLLDRTKSVLEEIIVDLFKPGTSQCF